MDSPSREHNELLNSEDMATQQMKQKTQARSLWRVLCCHCRRRAPKASPYDAVDRSFRPPAHAQVLPDFVLRMAAPYLWSIDIARLFSVDRASCSALALPGLVREMSLLLGIDENMMTTLAQLHLEQQIPVGTNVVNFEFMSTDIDKASQITLDRIAKLLRQHPSSQVSIEAHAQPGAPPDIARSISQERGNAVALCLRKRKVDDSRLRIQGYGTTRRLRSGSDKVHRRAEIFVSLGGVEFPRERLPVTHVFNSSDRFATWAAARDGSESGDSD